METLNYKNIIPLADRVLAKRFEQENKTPGGIIIHTDQSKENFHYAAVIAVGAGRSFQDKIIPLVVKTGDTIFFGKFAGVDLSDNHVMIREDEILGVINP